MVDHINTGANGADETHVLANGFDAAHDGSAVAPFEFSIITSDDHKPALSKELYIDRAGVIRKKLNGVLVAGSAKRVRCRSLREFANVLSSATSRQAITLGVVSPDISSGDEIRVASKKHQSTEEPEAVTKTDGVFTAPRGPGLMLLDHDLKGQPDHITEILFQLSDNDGAGGLRKLLQRAFPALKSAGFVSRASTSSGLFHEETGECFPGSGGEHNFIVAKDAADVKRATKDCARRLILAGFGWAIVSEGGGALIRTVTDRSVGGPERLIYEGAPLLAKPLKQAVEAREPVLSPGGLVDTLKAFPPLSDAEKIKYRAIVQKLRESIADELKAKRDEIYAKQRKDFLDRFGGDEAMARAAFDLRYQGRLSPAETLYFDDGAIATVGDVLADPSQFDGKTLADPIDPNDGRGKAKLFVNEGGDVLINSFAHGGSVYLLCAAERLFDDLDQAQPEDEFAADDAAGHAPGGEHQTSKDASEPTPLRVDMRRETKFPVHVLGPTLAAAVTGSAAACQAPLSLCGTSSLTIMSLLSQAHFDVEHPAARKRLPISLHAMTIGESGMRKSAVDDLLSVPLREHHNAAHQQYDRDTRDFILASKAYNAASAAVSASRRANYTPAERERDMRNLGPGPTRPRDPSIVTTAPTIEGLLRSFRDGMPSQALFSAEGGDFLGGYAMRPENRLATFSSLSKFWDGGVIRKTLGSELGSISIENRRLTLHLLAPEIVIATILADPVAQAQGLLGRILLTRPDSISGTREFRIAPEEEIEMCRQFHARASEMLQHIPRIDPNTNGVDPEVLRLTPDAVEVFRQFYNHVEVRLAPKGLYTAVKPFAEKVAEQSLRIAGVLTGVKSLDAREIDAETMSSAVELARYYLAENLRINETAEIVRDTSDGEMLAEWLRNHKRVGEQFTTREVQRIGPMPLRNGARIWGAIDALVLHGWVRRAAGKQHSAGGRPSDVWDILALNAE